MRPSLSRGWDKNVRENLASTGAAVLYCIHLPAKNQKRFPGYRYWYSSADTGYRYRYVYPHSFLRLSGRYRKFGMKSGRLPYYQQTTHLGVLPSAQRQSTVPVLPKTLPRLCFLRHNREAVDHQPQCVCASS